MIQYEPHSSQHEVPVVWESAYSWYVESRGKRYLDFTSGIFVANIGHGHPAVIKAIQEQLEKPLLHAYAFPNEARLKLEEKLCLMTGYEKVFLCSTGAEAVEAALRIMRGEHYRSVFSLRGANHGRTFEAKHLSQGFLDYEIHPKEYHFQGTAGIIFETYFGWNAQFHPIKWVQEWCAWAKQNNIPVCFDEIQAGFGRTGKLFGYEHYGVQPDLVCVGKALGGGLPISAVLGSAELLDAPDDLSSTHTGNPICCAAALATLDVLEHENLILRAAEMEGVFIEELARIGYPYNGKGMIWGIDLKSIDRANEVVDKCAERGLLLVKTHRGTIKIGPPLIMPEGVIRVGMNLLREAITDCD